jgi:sulfate transport system ATP-binding protein
MDIRIKGIAKAFGVSPALHGVDLDIRSGELIGLLGPSGSGKTTLLRIIAGLEGPSAGSIFFGEDDASTRTVQQRRVGFVFQHYALFRHMRVKDNVAYGLRVRPRRERPSKAEIGRRVGELLDLVQLGGLADRFPGQLSGGQRQRVALARALAVEPKVLLLDEPFGALDAKVRKDLRRWLREIHEKTGHTTVFVTHDQDEAMELSDRIAVLDRGRIEQVGVPDEIYDNPASPFVFSFIGESSRIPVNVSAGRVLVDGVPLQLPAAAVPDGPATLYVRPQDVRLAEPGQGVLSGLAVAQRRAGATRRAEIAVGAQRSIIEAEVPAGRSADLGRPVGLAIARATLFGADGRPAVLAPAHEPPGVVVRPPAFGRKG